MTSCTRVLWGQRSLGSRCRQVLWSISVENHMFVPLSISHKKTDHTFPEAFQWHEIILDNIADKKQLKETLPYIHKNKLNWRKKMMKIFSEELKKYITFPI